MNDARLRASRPLFYLLLLWLAALPWPLGANRDAIWLGFSALLFLLAAWALWLLPVWRCWQHTDRWLRLALAALAGITAFDLGRLLIARLVSPSSLLRLADPDAAALGAIQSAGVWVLAMLLVLLVRSRRRARWLMLAVFASGVAEAVLAIGVALSGSGLHWLGHTLGGEHASGTLINRNHFAGLMELSGAVGFGLLASGIAMHDEALSLRERLRRIGHALLGERFAVRAGLALIVVALVLTRSRMGNVGLFFGLGVAGLSALCWWRPLPRILMWLLLSIVAIDVLVLGAWVGVDKVAERLAETRLVAVEVAPERPIGDEGMGPRAADRPVRLEPSDVERWTVARASLALWRQRPWLGHGAGSFRTLFPSVKPASVQLFYEHAHNDYLELLVERGLLGLVLWLLAVAILLMRAVQVLRRHQDSLHRGLALTSLAAGSALLLHGLVDFNLQIPANRWWFHALILLGALARQVPLRRRREPTAGGDDTEPGYAVDLPRRAGLT